MSHLPGWTDRYRIRMPAEKDLWAAAILCYGFLDPGLTLVVMHLGGSEANQFAVMLLEMFGPFGFVVQKTIAFGLLAGIAWIVTVVGRLLGHNASPYRSVFATIVLVRGIHLVVIHLQNILYLVG